jgi:hypothetical protein
MMSGPYKKGQYRTGLENGSVPIVFQCDPDTITIRMSYVVVPPPPKQEPPPMYTVTVISNVTGITHSTDHDDYLDAIRDYSMACEEGVKYAELRQGDHVITSFTNRNRE